MKAAARLRRGRQPVSVAARRAFERKVASDIERSRGVTMNAELRSSLEPAFGHDFARIRIHSDDAAGRAAARLGARAFASGSHLFFAPGALQSNTSIGRRLLLHELAHSVQQGEGPAFAGLAPLALTTPGDALEREAEAAAGRVATGRPLVTGALTPDQPKARGTVGRFAIFALAFEHLLEAVDPALTVERIATETLQIYQSDPSDRSGRVHNQLVRIDEPTRRRVMEKIQARATAEQWQGLSRLLEEKPAPGSQAADTRADNIIQFPTRPTAGAPTATVTAEPAPEAPAPTTAAKPGAPAEEKLAAEGAVPTAAEGEPSPRVPKAEGVPEAEAPGGVAAGPAPRAEDAAARGVAGPPGGPAPAGAGGAEQPDLSAAERAGLPSAADAEREPPPGAVTGPAEAAAKPAPTPPPPPSAPAPPADAGPALPSSDSAAAAELESAAGSEEASGEGPEPAVPARGVAIPEQSSRPVGELPAGAAPAAETSREPAAATPAPVPDAPLPTEGGPAVAAATAEVAQETAPPVAAASPAAEPQAPETMAPGVPEVAEPGPEPTGESPAAGIEPLAAAPATPAVEAAPAAASEAAPAMAEAGAAPPVTEPVAAAAPATESAPEAPTGEVAAPVAAPAPVQVPEAPTGEVAAPVAAPAPEQATPAPPPATGVCAMVASALSPDAGGGDGGGGGACGGGAAAASEPAPPEPAPAPAADPVQAVDQAQGQSPAQVQQVMCGATDAANKSVDEKQQELAANPPTMERPSGSPADKDGAPAPGPPPEPTDKGPEQVEKVPAGQAVAPSPPEPLPAPPPVPVDAARPPAIPGESQIDEHAAAQVQNAVRSIPTTDPGLNVTPGVAPTVQLAGDADPEQGKRQREKLDESARQATDQGKQDAAQPMGEKDVYPQVPKETLRANPGAAPSDPAIPACTIGAGGGECGEVDETTSIVAKEKQGDQINASVAKARGDMVAGQQKNAEQVNQAQAENQRQVDDEVKQKAGEQTDARNGLQEKVGAQREKWAGEQRDLSDKAQTDADREGGSADKEITKQQQDANSEAAGHYKDADQKIATERQNAEQRAADKKKEGEKESSGGLLSKIGSAVTSFFDELKKAISDVFDAARKLVKGFIEAAQKLAAAVIDKARGLIVSAIHKLGDALIAIGDKLLAGFPGLRDKFRGAIKNLVQVAEKVVNEIADRLKKGIQKLLDLLGKVLDAYLCLLRAAYMAAISYVQSVVKSAIDFAKSVVQAFAAFAALIKDIAKGPGDWLSKLGSAVVSGIKNCLWSAFKRAVKQWFNSKLEEVLGLGLLIIRVLCQGGISFAEIGKMAWEGLKAAIPGILIQLLIEKLVAMIVPAAGAILTIIEGLRAAWGTVSRIIQAFELFFKFLQAVKTGNAAGPFAEAVAAAAIVVIDFVANWLLQRLMKPAGAISGRLKGMAQKFQKMFSGVARVAGRAVRAVGRGLRAAGRAIVSVGRRVVRAVGRAARAVGRGIARGARAVVRAIGKTRIGKALARGARRAWHAVAHSRLGKAVRKLWVMGRRKVRNLRNRVRRKWNELKEKRKQNADERLDRAEAGISPILSRLLQGGVSRAYLGLRLFGWQLRYLLSGLSVQANGDIVARINPRRRVGTSARLSREEIGAHLEPILRRAEEQFFANLAANRTASEQIRVAEAEKMIGKGRGENLPPLPRSEQIALLRRIREGQVPLAKSGQWINFSPTERIQIRDPNSFSGFFVQGFPREIGSSYPDVSRSLTRIARVNGIPEREVLDALRAPTGIESQARIAAMAGRIGDADQRSVFQRLAPATAFLHQSVEAARGPGLAAVQPLSLIAAERVQPAVGRSGELAPVSPVGATRQLERERFYGPHPEEGARLQTVRRQRIARIFVRIRQIATHRDLRVGPGGQGYALSRLGTAFQRWLNSHESRIADDAEKEASAALLEAEVLAFMEAFHGESG